MVKTEEREDSLDSVISDDTFQRTPRSFLFKMHVVGIAKY